MVQFMKDFGTIICTMEEENFIMLVVISMKVNLAMIWHKALVFTNTQTEVNTLVTGTRINNMALVKKNGLMEVNTKDSMKMLQKKVKVNTAGQMVIDTLVNGVEICLMVKVSSFGMMIDSS